MKPRKWVLALVVVLFILGGAFSWGMRLLERRLGLEQVVVEQIEPLIGGTFDVGDVRFGFLSVYLHDVSASLPLDAFLIDVQDIKVGFSLRRLLTTKVDFGRSISTIILVRPRLTVNLSPAGEPMTLPDSAAMQGIDIADIDFPLRELRVRKGSVRITGLGSEDLVFGEHLSGRIVDQARGIEFELYGRLASLRRNLALTGLIADDDAPNRLSLRLDGARLTTPVRLPACTITGGRADGLCELTFGGRGPAAPEATGWIRVHDGAASFPGVRQPLTDLTLALTLEGVLWHLDSLSGVFNGMHVHAEGTWDITRQQRSLLTVRAEAIDIGRMLPDLPKTVSDNFYGQGRIVARLVADSGNAAPAVSLSGTGFSVLGMPVTEVSGQAVVEPDRVRLDSVLVSTMAANLLLDGTVSVGDSFPSYHISYRCAIDSLPTLAWLEGRMLVRGEASGRTGVPQMDLVARLRDAHVFDIPLGTQSISVNGNGRRLRVETVDAELDVSVAGVVESPFSPSPHVTGTIHIGAEPIRAFLTRVSPLSDSIEGTYTVTAQMGGALPQWEAEALLTMDSPRVEGRATMTARMQRDDHQQFLSWGLSSEGLRVGQEAFPLFAAGRLYEDSMQVDSSRLLGGVELAGHIGLTKPDNVDLTIDFDTVSLAAVDRWFFDGRLPLDSGALIGHSRVRGVRKNIVSNSELSVRDLAIGDLTELETDAVVSTAGGTVQALPLVLRKDGRVVVALDTILWGEQLRLKGEFDAIDIASFLGPALLRDVNVQGAVSGTFSSSDSGLPVAVHVHSPKVEIEGFAIDSITLDGRVDSGGMVFERITAHEGRRCRLSASAEVPWSFLGPAVGENDTLWCAMRIAGDLLESVEHNYCDVILGGSGEGTISASLHGTQQGWDFEALTVSIPTGELTSKAYVPSGVSDFSLSMDMDDSNRVHTRINGYIGRRAVSIRSTHDIPSGYRSFEFGPIDFGILLAETPRQGVAIHLPGFHEPGETGEVEFRPLPPFSAFALSGPIDEIKLTGTWVLRNCEFTFPLFENDEVPLDVDPFPFITWEMDIAVGNRNVRYYWDLSGRRRRNLIRFVEAYLDPSSRIKLRGRDRDGTFQVLGAVRSYKGSVYFGKVFDRRFEVGLDFAPQQKRHGGYNNMPIIWGSAEAFSDTSRLERVTLTLQLTDPHSGGLSERGRVAMIPRPKETRRRPTPGEGDSIPNFVFHLSSDFDQVAGETEREFFREAGLRFTSFEGAGELISSMGEQYLHRYLLQRFERRLAKRLGLDVITFETSIASNYFRKFYSREFSEITDQWNLLALAHVGVTIGRYFFRDNLFIKARGELVPIEELLVPEYSIGFEFQPVHYLFLDFNYGIHRGETSIEHDPRLNMQLRFPLTRLRKLWKF